MIRQRLKMTKMTICPWATLETGVLAG